MSHTYEISAQEIWLVEKTYKCSLLEAIGTGDGIAIIHEMHEKVITKRLKNSFQKYPNGFLIDWGDFTQSETFKIREVQLVSTITYSINDSTEDATYCYENAYESTEPGDYSVLECRFIDDDNFYSVGYKIDGVELA